MSRTPELLDDDLVRAAEILEREAGFLRDSHATRVGRRWSWCGEARPRADHDEMIALAKRFRKIAGTL